MTDHQNDDELWNHSIDAWKPLLARIPEGARTALDVGTGDGYFARSLAAKGLDVTAIDPDERSLAVARALDATRISYVLGDVLTADLPRGGFDVVAAVAAVHHMELDAALTRLRDLVAPGGVLLIVGLAQSNLPRDIPRGVLSALAAQTKKRGRAHWESVAPTVWPPPHTFLDVKRAGERLLPGSRFARTFFYRYTLVWEKPATGILGG